MEKKMTYFEFAEAYEAETADYLAESYANGNFSQVVSLFNELDDDGKKLALEMIEMQYASFYVPILELLTRKAYMN